MFDHGRLFGLLEVTGVVLDVKQQQDVFFRAVVNRARTRAGQSDLDGVVGGGNGSLRFVALSGIGAVIVMFTSLGLRSIQVSVFRLTSTHGVLFLSSGVIRVAFVVGARGGWLPHVVDLLDGLWGAALHPSLPIDPLWDCWSSVISFSVTL